nr:MAG TPA: hypothetical protein [Bacteriophage sp.]
MMCLPVMLIIGSKGNSHSCAPASSSFKLNGIAIGNPRALVRTRSASSASLMARSAE